MSSSDSASRFDVRGYGPQSVAPSPSSYPHPAPAPPILRPPRSQYPGGHPQPPLPPTATKPAPPASTSSSSSSQRPPDGRLVPGPGDPPMEAGGAVVHGNYLSSGYSNNPPIPTEQPPPGHYALPPLPPPHFGQHHQPEYADVERTLRTVTSILSVEHLSHPEPRTRARNFAQLPPAAFNNLLQSALDGLRILNPAAAERYAAEVQKQLISEPHLSASPVVRDREDAPPQQENGSGGRSGDQSGADDEEEGPESKKRAGERQSLYAIHANMRPTYQRREERLAEPQECLSCHAKSSPEWRRGPYGPRTLCNACGLVYIKIMKRRARGLPDEEDDDEDDDQISGDETDSR